MKLYHALFELGSKEAGSSAGKRAGEFIHSFLTGKFPDCVVTKEPFLINRQRPIQAHISFDNATISGHLYENTGVEGSEIQGHIMVAKWWSLLWLVRRFRAHCLT